MPTTTDIRPRPNLCLRSIVRRVMRGLAGVTLLASCAADAAGDVTPTAATPPPTPADATPAVATAPSSTSSTAPAPSTSAAPTTSAGARGLDASTIIDAFVLPDAIGSWVPGANPLDPMGEQAAQTRATIAATPGCEAFAGAAPATSQSYADPAQPASVVSISLTPMASGAVDFLSITDPSAYALCVQAGFRTFVPDITVTAESIEPVELPRFEGRRLTLIVESEMFGLPPSTSTTIVLVAAGVQIEIALPMSSPGAATWSEDDTAQLLGDVSARFDAANS